MSVQPVPFPLKKANVGLIGCASTDAPSGNSITLTLTLPYTYHGGGTKSLVLTKGALISVLEREWHWLYTHKCRPL